MKIYPWRERVRDIEGKYGVFPDFQNMLFWGWSTKRVYNTPAELGEEVGAYLSQGVHASGVQLRRVLPTIGEDRHVIQFLEKGEITGLDSKEFIKFRDTVRKKYPQATE